MRQRIGTRAAVVAGALGLLAAVAAAFAACVPDLIPSELPPPEAAPPPPPCGDGFIDIEAGEQCDPGEAGLAGCTRSCTVDCPSGGFVDDASMHCYFAPGNKPLPLQGSSSAKEACVQAGGPAAHVVSFATDDEYAAVFDASADAFWTGLAQISPIDNSWGMAQPVGQDFEPGFTDNCPGCYARATDAGNFPRANPEAGVAFPCTVSGSKLGGPWRSADCARQSFGVVCEREPPGALTQECNGLLCMTLRATFGAKRYVYIDQPLSAADAAAFCSNFTGGRLVVLRTAPEREQLWRELSRLPTPPIEVWVGLSFSGDAGGWTWDDGTDASLAPWGVSQPRGLDEGAPRAYLYLDPVVQGTDSQLARNADQDPESKNYQPPVDSMPFVCEAAP